MPRGEHGEQVGARGSLPDSDRQPAPWCRHSADCYKRGVPLHRCEPSNGKPYMDGCPRNETACAIAQVIAGKPWKEAETFEPPRSRRHFAKRRCTVCRLWYMPTAGHQKYCPACAEKRKREYHKRYYREHREELKTYYREYYAEHPEKRREKNRKHYLKKVSG